MTEQLTETRDLLWTLGAVLCTVVVVGWIIWSVRGL